MTESWMYCYNPSMKQSATRWVKKGSELPLQQHVVKSAEKVMMIIFFFFFNKKCVIFSHRVPHNQTANKGYMVKMLHQLTSVHILWNRPKFKKGLWKLNMDNTRLHMVALKQVSFSSMRTKRVLKKWVWLYGESDAEYCLLNFFFLKKKHNSKLQRYKQKTYYCYF